MIGTVQVVSHGRILCCQCVNLMGRIKHHRKHISKLLLEISDSHTSIFVNKHCYYTEKVQLRGQLSLNRAKNYLSINNLKQVNKLAIYSLLLDVRTVTGLCRFLLVNTDWWR